MIRKISFILAFMFAVTFTFASFSLLANAEEKTEKAYSSLEDLAEDYLVRATQIDKKGESTVVVRNIPEFTEAAHRYFPDLDDAEIARFVYRYTGLSENPEELPDDVVLEILENATSTDEEDVSVPEAEAEDDKSELMKIVFVVAGATLIIAGAVAVVVIKNKKEKTV